MFSTLSMLHFVWPWAFAALPFPWLVRYFLPPVSGGGEPALKIPFLEDFEGAGRFPSPRRGRRWVLLLASLSWLLLVTAAARPQWQGPAVPIPSRGRDLMLAVDLSGSMRIKDFRIHNRTVDRLDSIKWVADDFIKRRIGDRMGLILFGSEAYLQVPLTFDYKTVRTLLDQAVVGMAGDQTAIGDAIGLAIKRLRNEPSSSRVLILLTDGANDAGVLEPLKAAELAAAAGLKIYTIGIGADAMYLRSFLGVEKVNPSRDLDEKALKAIARKTGGRYFRATDTAQLENIYALIDKLEPVEHEGHFYRPTVSLFAWPLGLSLGLVSLLGLTALFDRETS
ncbi:MAG: VWA domain-containing protein [Desulfuromonadales bacterium]